MTTQADIERIQREMDEEDNDGPISSWGLLATSIIFSLPFWLAFLAPKIVMWFR